jgi:hypothetical protein
MKKNIRFLFCILSFIFFIEPIFGLSNKLETPPYNKIENIDIIELKPEEVINYDDYKERDYKEQAEDGLWSTIWKRNLIYLNKSLAASSTLNKYNVNNIIDQNTNTAWVEGAKGDGLKEWISIKLDADKRSLSSTPFTIYWFAMIPGYAKSQKTWKENNRVKTALLIINSPKAPESEYIACRLQFEDTNKLQVFRIPDDLIVQNQDPMTKKLWLVIEEVYKGKKYSDTCISEVVVRGGCLP